MMEVVRACTCTRACTRTRTENGVAVVKRVRLAMRWQLMDGRLAVWHWSGIPESGVMGRRRGSGGGKVRWRQRRQGLAQFGRVGGRGDTHLANRAEIDRRGCNRVVWRRQEDLLEDGGCSARLSRVNDLCQLGLGSDPVLRLVGGSGDSARHPAEITLAG